MSAFANLVTEDQRLRILQLLDQTEGYDLNLRILTDALAVLGHRPSQDKLRSEVAWLEEQGLVSTREVGSILVVTATERGIDVAHGRGRMPGVKRPAPE